VTEHARVPRPLPGRPAGDEPGGHLAVPAPAALAGSPSAADLVSRFVRPADAQSSGAHATTVGPFTGQPVLAAWAQAATAGRARPGLLSEPLAEPLPPPLPEPAEEPIDRTLVRLRPIATELSVRSTDLWTEAGRQVIGVHFGRMRARVAGAIEAEDPEELHAMRLSARRLRAAWRVFRDGFEPVAVNRYRSQLRLIGRTLGTARDLDVQLALLVSYAGRRSPREAARLEPLAVEWLMERLACQADVTELLRSTPFANLCREFEEFARTDGFLCREDGAPVRRVRDRAGSATWTAYEAVLAFDGELARMDADRLHRLRIAVKRLRYTLESLRQPLEPASTRLLRRVVDLQDRLGDLRDFAAAADRAEQRVLVGSELTKDQRTAVVRFARHLRRRADTSRRSLPRSWAAVRGPRFRADLGRALVSAWAER